MPLNDQTPAVTLYNSSEVEVGTSANPLFLRDATTAALANGAQTTVSSAAVSVLAANANRKTAIIQNVGNQTVRVGVAGVTATTGIQLTAGATLILGPPYIVTSQIFAIREGGADSTVFAAEIT